MRIALVTCARLPGLDPDDHPLRDALAARGHEVEAVVWTDPSLDWSRFDGAVLRSTWDYHLQRPAFLAWAERVASVTRLVHPLPIVRWNTDKRYLAELSRAGAPVVPTEYLDAGQSADLGAVLRRRGWSRAVVKPAVSADSWGTVRATGDDLPAAQAHLDALLAERDVMVQPYLASVEEPGERCLVFLDGELSHAVRKRSLFLGGRHVGPEGVDVPIADDERDAARRVLAACPFRDLLYARVDLLRDEAGVPCLMELELCEPTLFFSGRPKAVDRYVDGLLARLSQGCRA